MTILEHLQEARKRLLWALAGVGIAAVFGWFLYKPIIEYMMRPLGGTQTLNFTTVGGAFDLQLNIALWAGLVLSTPWWTAQLWIYLWPALHKHERRYLAGFTCAGTLLFLGGTLMGLWTAPRAIQLLNEFAPTGSTSLLSAQQYVNFYLGLLAVFGISALLPLALVMLNFAGIISARWMLARWRWATMGSFTFAAIANPLPQPWSMIVQALILLAVYFAAVGIAALREFLIRRRTDN